MVVLVLNSQAAPAQVVRHARAARRLRLRRGSWAASEGHAELQQPQLEHRAAADAVGPIRRPELEH